MIELFVISYLSAVVRARIVSLAKFIFNGKSKMWLVRKR